ncbi:MAG TPA: ABC transporter permease [Dehalococcoidia bacterium]|nr:ABC transporter permease [Dehalococcoidia bacterium]
MISKAAWATALRVLHQVQHDRRTVALILLVPMVLLIPWVFDDHPEVFDRVGLPLVGVFPLVSMFLVTSITMLRERVSGTLERLMTLPMSKLDLLIGYALAFGSLATVQATLVALVGFVFLDLEAEGPKALVVGLAVLNALLGMSLGLFVSAFARTEFEAVQFMPALLIPQFLLSGVMIPRDQMATALEYASLALPMRYGLDAMERVRDRSDFQWELALDAGVVGAVTLGLLALAALTMRRRTT